MGYLFTAAASFALGFFWLQLWANAIKPRLPAWWPVWFGGA